MGCKQPWVLTFLSCRLLSFPQCTALQCCARYNSAAALLYTKKERRLSFFVGGRRPPFSFFVGGELASPPCTGLRSSPIRPAKLVPLLRSKSIEMRSISIVSTKRSFVLEQRSCSEASPLSLGRKKEAYKKERVSFFLTTLLRRVQCCSTAWLVKTWS